MHRTRWWSGAILALLISAGLGARLCWVLDVQPPAQHDARWYTIHAKGFAAGRGIVASGGPTAYRPPGYVVLLGGAYRFWGRGPLVVGLLHVGIAGLTLLCLYSVARRLTGSRATARWATLLYAAYPTDIAYSSLATSELLFNLCMLAGTVAILRRTAVGLVAASVSFGAAMLTRGNGVLLAPVVGFFAPGPLYSGAFHRALRSGVMCALVALLTLPWVYRNYGVFDGFVPIANNGGVNLFIGNNPLATGCYRFDDEVTRGISVSGLAGGGWKEYAVDVRLRGLAERYMIAHPLEALSLWPRKLACLFERDHTAFEWNRARDTARRPLFTTLYAISHLYYIALCTLAVAGAVAWMLRDWGMRARSAGVAVFAALAWAVGAPWIPSLIALGLAWIAAGSTIRLEKPTLAFVVSAALIGMQLIYFGDSRFHHPIMPWACISAGGVLVMLTAGPWRERLKRVTAR